MTKEYMHQFMADDLKILINIGNKFKDNNRVVTITGFSIYNNGTVDINYTDKSKTPYGAELNWFLNKFKLIK